MGEQIFIAQSWVHHGKDRNDDVKILGVFSDLKKANKCIDKEYLEYFNRKFGRNIFELSNKQKLIYETIKPQFGQLLSQKIIDYVYPKFAVTAGNKIQGKIYDNQTILLKLKKFKIYSQLIDFRSWICNTTDLAYFTDYRDISIMINHHYPAVVRKISSDTIRIYLFDPDRNQMTMTIFIGINMVDIESCDDREKHFCSAFRVLSAILQ